MPSFNFSVSKKEKRKANKTYSKYETILKNVTGIICIDINAKYNILVDNKKYIINSECYSCKGKQYIYRQGEHDPIRCLYIRLYDKCEECNSNMWLPFTVGCVVKGNVIRNKNTNIETFFIKNCYIDFDNEESIKQINFYKEHIKEINDCIRLKRLNES